MRALFLQIAIVGSLMLISFESGQWWQSRQEAIICTPTEIAQMEHRHAGQ